MTVLIAIKYGLILNPVQIQDFKFVGIPKGFLKDTPADNTFGY